MNIVSRLARPQAAAPVFLALTIAIAAVGYSLSYGLAPQAQLISGVAAQATLLERMDRAVLVIQTGRAGAAWPPDEVQRQRAVLTAAMTRFDSTLRALREGGVVYDPAGHFVTIPALDAGLPLDRVERAWRARSAAYSALLAGAPQAQTEPPEVSEAEPLPLLLNELTREIELQHNQENHQHGRTMLAGLTGIAALYAFLVVASSRRLRSVLQQREEAVDLAARQIEDNRLLTQVAARTSNLALITDARGRIIWVNASFERATGWTLDEVRGRRPGDVLQGPLTDAKAIGFMGGELQGGRGFSGVEIINYDRAGRPYWVEIDVQPLFGADGQVSHFIAIESVVTERRAAMAELTRARDAAEQASLAKTRLLARASHELRTPLNGMLGLAQVLLADDRLRDVSLRSHLRTICVSGKHMAALVDDMLDLSRAEVDELPVAREVVDLERLLESVCRILSAQAARLEVAVSWKMHEGARFALGDTVRVRQVALNLLSNAIKYSHRGGQVLVTCERVGPGIELAVADAGPGLSPQQLSQLFEPFNRLGAERTQVPGTGIGLVIARRMAELMHGELTVESAPGVGSRFALRLQAAQGEQLADLPTATDFGTLGPALIPRAGSVLYVEDNPVNSLVFEACVLSRSDLAVHLASDGREALEMVARVRPDLIVLDLNLPDTDGFELSSALRELPGMASVPHCLLTADNTAPVTRRAHELGFARVWAKPLDTHVLMRDMAGLLPRPDRDDSRAASLALTQTEPT